MTVSELIEQLKSYPSDMRVLTLGYEGGYNDIVIKNRPIELNINTWYYGPHEMCASDDPNVTRCVIVGRE
jgi:hypothetical protein